MTPKMTARIEELAKHCMSLSFYVDTASENFDYVKFAKLVARECGSIYSSIDNGNECMGTDDYLKALYRTFEE